MGQEHWACPCTPTEQIWEQGFLKQGWWTTRTKRNNHYTLHRDHQKLGSSSYTKYWYLILSFANPIWKAWTSETNLQLPAGTHANSFTSRYQAIVFWFKFWARVCSCNVCCNELFVGNFIRGVPHTPWGTKLNSNKYARSNPTLTPDNLDLIYPL